MGCGDERRRNRSRGGAEERQSKMWPSVIERHYPNLVRAYRRQRKVRTTSSIFASNAGL
jgi:hypothetical protein